MTSTAADTIDLPYRLEPFGMTGWTVVTMTATAAAAFVRTHAAAAMPCWKRFDIVNDRLVLTR